MEVITPPTWSPRETRVRSSGRFASKVRDRTQRGHGPECAALFIGRAVRRTTCQLKGFMMQS